MFPKNCALRLSERSPLLQMVLLPNNLFTAPRFRRQAVAGELCFAGYSAELGDFLLQFIPSLVSF